MKYFIIFFLSFAVVAPVYAVKTVKGTVPVPPSLQTLDANSHANFSSNIQATASAQSQLTQPDGQRSAPAPASQTELSNNPGARALTKTAGNNWIWLAVLLVIAAAIFWWVWVRKQGP